LDFREIFSEFEPVVPPNEPFQSLNSPIKAINVPFSLYSSLLCCDLRTPGRRVFYFSFYLLFPCFSLFGIAGPPGFLLPFLRESTPPPEAGVRIGVLSPFPDSRREVLFRRCPGIQFMPPEPFAGFDFDTSRLAIFGPPCSLLPLRSGLG